jgi:hypothetical protein
MQKMYKNLKVQKIQPSHISKEIPDNITITKFKIEETLDNAHYALIGMRGSGKSYIIRNIIDNLWKNKRIDSCIVFSPSDRMSSFYSDFVNEDNIYFECKPKIIQKILDKQKELGKERKNICVVLDDCLSSKGEWVNNATYADFLFNARNYGITYFLAMQFPLGIKPDLRSNFDYVLALNDATVSNQKRIHEHYAGFIPDFDTFRQTFEQVTSNYNCMCIHNKDNTVNFYNANKRDEDFMIEKILIEKVIDVVYDISDIKKNDWHINHDSDSSSNSNSSSSSSIPWHDKPFKRARLNQAKKKKKLLGY